MIRKSRGEKRNAIECLWHCGRQQREIKNEMKENWDFFLEMNVIALLEKRGRGMENDVMDGEMGE